MSLFKKIPKIKRRGYFEPVIDSGMPGNVCLHGCNIGLSTSQGKYLVVQAAVHNTLESTCIDPEFMQINLVLEESVALHLAEVIGKGNIELEHSAGKSRLSIVQDPPDNPDST